MDRWSALEVLGLPSDSDLAEVKQRFRTLARHHHPDRGGDPTAFQDLHAAYAALLAHHSDREGETAPRVARGRPSRSDGGEGAARLLDGADLDVHTAALVTRITAAGTCRMLSRAPGAWSNRFAASLAEGTTSTLQVRLDVAGDRSAPSPSGAPAGRRTAHVELTGRSRGARHALSALDLQRIDGAAWARRRGDAITVVEAQLTGEDVERVAHRAAAATTRLLAALRWPLPQWSVG